MLHSIFEHYKYGECRDIFGIGAIGSSIADNITNGVGNNQANLANVAQTQMTNRANVKMNKDTNEANIQMNKENNDLQVQLANEAYERSKPITQMQNLMEMGLSEFQARQIVAGSGSPAAMPMPTTTAAVATPGHVDPASIQPYHMDSSGLASGLSQLSGDILSPDGGAIGQLLYNDVLNEFESLDGFDPTQFTSMGELKAFSLEKDDSGNYVRPKWAEIANGQKFERCYKSFMGRRAYNADHSRVLDSKNKNIDYSRNKVGLSIDNAELQQKNLDYYYSVLRGEDYELVRDLENDFALTKLKSDLDLFGLRSENNKEYLTMALENFLKSEENQKYYLMGQKLHLDAQYKAYKNNPEMVNFSAVYKIFDECGLTNTDVGVVIAYLESSGISIVGDLKKWISDQSGSDGDGDGKLHVGGKVKKWYEDHKARKSNDPATDPYVSVPGYGYVAKSYARDVLGIVFDDDKQ